MNIQQAIECINRLKDSLPEIFSESEIVYAFGDGRPHIGDDSIDDFRGFLGGDNDIGKGCGVYIFTTESNEITYIGKAATKSLHNRVWDHVKTPKRRLDGWMTFPQTTFRSSARPELETEIINGVARLHVFTISNPDVVSLVEVYLQIFYKLNYGILPPFNKQIG